MSLHTSRHRVPLLRSVPASRRPRKRISPPRGSVRYSGFVFNHYETRKDPWKPPQSLELFGPRFLIIFQEFRKDFPPPFGNHGACPRPVLSLPSPGHAQPSSSCLLNTMAAISQLPDAADRANRRNAVPSGFLGWTIDAFDFFVLILSSPPSPKTFTAPSRQSLSPSPPAWPCAPSGLSSSASSPTATAAAACSSPTFFSTRSWNLLRLRAHLHDFLPLPLALRHRHGWHLGRWRIAGHGIDPAQLARLCLRDCCRKATRSATCSPPSATTPCFRTGDGARCFSSAPCRRC